jgi:hypothetical protein
VNARKRSAVMPEIEHSTGKRTSTDVEAIIAKHTVRRAVFVAPVLIGLFAVLRGTEGAIASAVGCGVVVMMFLVSGWMLSISARLGLSAYYAAALFGFFVRLGLLTGAMVLITKFTDLDKMAFGITAVVAYLILLTWETVAISRGAERELEWIH